MLTLKQKLAGLVATIAALFTFAVPLAHANPSSFCYDSTAGATSTLVYMTPGAATTTLTTFNCADRAIALDALTLVIQATASSTGPVLNYRVEGSMDNIDWYPLGGPIITSGTVGTSTPITGNYANTAWTVLTTTDRGGSGTATRIHTAIQIPVLAPYMRVIFADQATPAGINLGLWAQLIGRRQILGR